MKQYRKLYIKVDSEHSAEFVASLDAALKGGWSRAHEAEERAGKSSIDDEFLLGWSYILSLADRG